MQFKTWHPVEDVFAEVRERAASTVPITAACGRMLLGLVEYLQSRGPTPQAGVMYLNNVLTIFLEHPNRSMDFWVDWQDYGETRDGLPVMHYRLQIEKPNSELSEKIRASTTVEAACLILTA